MRYFGSFFETIIKREMKDGKLLNLQRASQKGVTEN